MKRYSIKMLRVAKVTDYAIRSITSDCYHRALQLQISLNTGAVKGDLSIEGEYRERSWRSTRAFAKADTL